MIVVVFAFPGYTNIEVNVYTCMLKYNKFIVNKMIELVYLFFE